MSNPVVVRTKAAKAWAAFLGTTLTALLSFNAAVQVAAEDDAFDLGEVSSLASGAISLVGTVYAVWKFTNTPIRSIPAAQSRNDYL